MKRIIVDVFFILVLVCLGSSFNSLSREDILEDRIRSFEEQIANHEIIDMNSSAKVTYQTEENFAGRLGEDLSGFVIQAVHDSIKFIGDLVYEFKN